MLLSVITVNLNNDLGLQKSIKSLLGQNFNDHEFIVIDGGSNDGSVETIRRFSNEIKYWVSEPDRGIYHAMNKGILNARGEYCYFLNSGDRFVNNTVLRHVFVPRPTADIIFGNLLVHDRHGKLKGRANGRQGITFLDIYNGLLKHQASFIKTSLFQRYGLYNESLRIVADWEFFLKSVGLGDASTEYFDVDVCYFDNEGISNQSWDVVARERTEVLEKHVPKRIRDDYARWQPFDHLERVAKYRPTRFVLKLINKGLKIYENRHS